MPKGVPLSDEQKEKMRAGRKAFQEAKAAAVAELVADYFPPPQPAPGGVLPEPEPVPVSEPDDDERDPRFTAFLAALDAETREMFTIDVLADRYAKKLLVAEAEKKAAKLKALDDKALELARIEVGLTPPESAERKRVSERNSEMVKIRIDLPDDAQGVRGPPKGIFIDQMIYVDGVEYTVSRAVAADLMSMMYRAHQHEMQFQGRSRTFYNRMRGRFEHPGGFARGAGLMAEAI